MTTFNRFGAGFADVIALYPGTVVTDYDAGGAAGQVKVEAALDRACRRFAMAFPPEVYRQVTHVDCEMPVRYATDGQASFVLGLGPIIAETLHVWRYPSLVATESMEMDTYSRKPALGWLEETGFSTGGTTTVTVTPATTLALGQRVFASYDVDRDAATFAMPSVADLCLYGAAVELGAFLYSEGTQEWKLVEEYRQRWTDALKAVADGSWIPEELRKLSYWQDVERASDEVKSVRRYRG